MKKPATFSTGTLPFLVKAGRQKRPDWLERNRPDYERLVLEPLRALAETLKRELGPIAPGYHFPVKGIGRLRRSGRSAAERGGSCFKNWMAYSASRPTESRFDHNPNLFFLMNPTDDDDPVLVAGGLYMPSSRQLRAVREAIARDPGPFERLFESRAFRERFPGGFSLEKSATRSPRGFDPNHPRAEWLRLQAHFVWRPVKISEFRSARFTGEVVADFGQILRLNELLEEAIGLGVIRGKKPRAGLSAPGKRAARNEPEGPSLLDRLDLIDDRPSRPLD